MKTVPKVSQMERKAAIRIRPRCNLCQPRQRPANKPIERATCLPPCPKFFSNWLAFFKKNGAGLGANFRHQCPKMMSENMVIDATEEVREEVAPGAEAPEPEGKKKKKHPFLPSEQLEMASKGKRN
jgi:hypothetical protein